MEVVVWYVKGSKMKFNKNNIVDHPFWISSVMNYFRKYQYSMPVFAGVVGTEIPKMSIGAVAGVTFGPNGVGFVLLQVLLLAVVGYMIDWICVATHHKQLGSMAKTITVLSAFALVVGAIFNALQKLWSIIG